VSLSQPVNGEIVNTNAITFEESLTEWGTMTDYVIFDSEEGDTLLMYGPLTISRKVEQNTVVMIREGELKISLENPQNSDIIAGVFDTVEEMQEWSDAQHGDIAIVNLVPGIMIYMLTGENPATLSNWKEIAITS